MKIDLRRAYDKMNWEFLDIALDTWGFSLEFRGLINSYLSSMSLNLLLNGSLCGNIVPKRDLL